MEVNNFRQEIEELKKHKIETDDLHITIKILVNVLDENTEDLVVSICITMNVTISGVLS